MAQEAYYTEKAAGWEDVIYRRLLDAGTAGMGIGSIMRHHSYAKQKVVHEAIQRLIMAGKVTALWRFGRRPAKVYFATKYAPQPMKGTD